MKESATTAVSYVRSRAERLMLDPEWLKTIDLHLHVPRRAASREDGAGLGIPMFASVASLLLDIPTRSEVAATGEITLRGTVLPVSGVKDKILAAHRAGLKEIVLTAKNERDTVVVAKVVLVFIELRFVNHADEVLQWMLETPARTEARGPLPRPSEEMHP